MKKNQKFRQKDAMERLENQLKSMVKPCSETGKNIPLNESDRKRINKEIDILKKRI